MRHALWLLALGALSQTACSLGKEPAKIQVTSVAPEATGNYSDTPIEILGKGFAALAPKDCALPCKLVRKEKGGVRLEMWQGSPERLQRGFSLEKPEVVTNTRMRAVVPAGVPAGTYHLVVRRGLGVEFTKASLRVRELVPNAGPPQITGIRPANIQEGHPARLVIRGANLHDPVAVYLVGPLPEYNELFPEAAEAGFEPPWPFRNSAPHKLPKVWEENPSRISAAVPPDLPPGKYSIQIATSTHKGQPVDWDHLFVIRPKHSLISERTAAFSIYFAIMGAVFLVGMIFAWRQGDVGLRRGKKRNNLLWMLGGLLFYVVLIGSLQFWLSGWY